jgi:hypothetical protein
MTPNAPVAVILSTVCARKEIGSAPGQSPSNIGLQVCGERPSDVCARFEGFRTLHDCFCATCLSARSQVSKGVPT